jgi:CBS domain-containing protein
MLIGSVIMSRVESFGKVSDLRVRPTDPVRLIMSSPVATLDVGTTLQEAAEEMVRNDIGAVLVSDGARTGLISERDVVSVLGALGGAASTQIDQTATWDLLWAAPEDSIAVVGELMLEANVRHVPIGNRHSDAIGIVSIRDVLAVLVANRQVDAK